MKNTIKIFALLMVGMLMLTSCIKSDIKGFKKTKSGLHYKIVEQAKGGEALQYGDIIVGELVVRLDDNVFYSNEGHVDRVMKITDSVYRDFNIGEGLLMLHKGDKAIFAIYADSLFRFYPPQQMPAPYVKGKGQIIYYEVKVEDRVSVAEQEVEQRNFQEQMIQRKEQEASIIADYVAKNNIKVAPNAEGLYIIVRKQGNGPRVAAGRTVALNYTGRLLDGTVFDSSVESVAREAGLGDRPYEPLTYEVGRMSLIRGWEMGIEGMPAGTELTLIIPSKLGYGANGAGDKIEPYSPLCFDITIESVK